MDIFNHGEAVYILEEMKSSFARLSRVSSEYIQCLVVKDVRICGSNISWSVSWSFMKNTLDEPTRDGERALVSRHSGMYSTDYDSVVQSSKEFFQEVTA